LAQAVWVCTNYLSLVTPTILISSWTFPEYTFEARAVITALRGATLHLKTHTEGVALAVGVNGLKIE